MMKSEITRSKNNTRLTIIKDQKKKTILREDLLAKFNTSNTIRIKQEEYGNIPQPIFTHFNLQTTNHLKGEKYILAKIVQQGFFNTTTEQQPLLSLENVYVAECIDIKNNLSYDELTNDDFKHSMKHIKNKEELQKTILKRYKKSMPQLTTKEILDLGVAKTTLRIL